jgi:PAS domain S-box-containing protein
MSTIAVNQKDISDAQINTHQYEALFNNTIIGILISNNAGEIMHVNRFAETQFGYDYNELIGKPVEILIPEKYRVKHKTFHEGFYSHPQTRTMGEGRDLRARRKDGSEFAAEISLSHYEQGGQNFVIVFIVDITIRKNTEELLLRQKEEMEKVTMEITKLNLELEKKVSERTLILYETMHALEKSQKELEISYEKEKELGELKSRFVAMASHEFRTPLSTILSSLSLVKKYSAIEQIANRERHIEKIQNAVKSLIDILEDFLSLGKLEDGRVEVNLTTITQDAFMADMEELLQEVNMAYDNGHCITLAHSFRHNQLIADRKLLRNILINLISNAIKYSAKKSTIQVNCSSDADYLQISVSDEGIGISEEDQQHLFERFYRAGNATHIQGTGLGLHIVGRYMGLMHGKITVKSTLSKGTTVTIYIPQHKKSA